MLVACGAMEGSHKWIAVLMDLQNFFINAKDAITRPSPNPDAKANDVLQEALRNTQQAVEVALCNSFDTREAMNGKNGISELISTYNSAKNGSISPDTISDIAKWITSIVNIFGLNGEASPESEIIGWSGIEIPDNAKPYAESVSRLRDQLRLKARSAEGLTAHELESTIGGVAEVTGTQEPSSNSYQQVLQNFKAEATSLLSSPNLSKAILSLTDRVRDVDLWNCDIYLEDRENEPALIRPVTRELRAARQEKENRERAKQLAKTEREKQAAARAEKGRLSHLDMFRTSEYSAWDEDGIPTKDAEGVDITKSRDKKLRKDQAAQKKLHEAWTSANPANINS